MSDSLVRDKILDTASRLFFEQGYNLTGINQIIEEADIARGSLYNHFGSKSELLLAYLDKAQQERLAETEAYVKTVKDPQKKLLGIFDYRIQRQQQIGYRGCQFIKICAEVSRDDIKVFELVEAHKERLRNFILDLVRQTTHNPVLSDELFADTVFLLLEGSTTSVGFSRNVRGLRQARKIVEGLLVS
ncbi:MAG: TetR/AcrR family transcriptional regulator [Puia sp.]|nr:TetR/AcrR family transcriptional regulator [Puia sp.]